MTTRARTDVPSGYGGLLLATLLLWAYMHAMQYIIIWAGNIPSEVTWYMRRESGGWAFVLARRNGSWRVKGYGWAVTFRSR